MNTAISILFIKVTNSKCVYLYPHTKHVHNINEEDSNIKKISKLGRRSVKNIHNHFVLIYK